MKIGKKLLLIFLAAGSLSLLTGCFFTKHPSESQIPWARPAAWQNKTPGIGF